MPTEEFRRSLMTRLGRFADGTGLEVGPLNRPVALKSLSAVRYVGSSELAGLRVAG